MNGSITISRRSDDIVEVSLRDNISRTVFAKFQMDLASLGMAITGLGEVQGNLVTNGLENVGKVKVTEQRSVVCPHKYFKRGVFESWLEENCHEEGWILNTYLGSQNSTRGCDEGTILNYSVTKYVQQED